MQSHERSGVEIPAGVKVDDIMRSLAIGHGYKWTVLTRDPLIIAHGAPTVGNMPELLLTGKKPMIVAGGDAIYVERIRNILEMLQRQSHRVQFTKEG
ncbi:MAG: hypothetical protein E4H14_07845 [Candidatus Thorarchaeota archaeon]|nr:MAG: hypothetical protein E4H14_07845 [Candidatus Thorarchaeota archaeon]